MKNGYTLIEVMIVVAIIGVISAFAVRFYNVNNGVRCVGGYQFAVDFQGRNTQILDNQGHGIPCQ